jgi:hypothetical protein
MRMLQFVLIAAFSATSAFSQSTTPPPVLPQNFTVPGTFDCSGAFRSGKTHKTTFTASAILNNTWLEFTEQDVEPATGYVAKYLIGYDQQAKHFVEFDANNFGAATYSSEAGWQNGALTLTSARATDPKAPYAANRFTYTVTSPNTFTVDWQISRTSALNWITSDHFTCKRR